jgi:HAD superfamily hydrolase (TIGR01509 family)
MTTRSGTGTDLPTPCELVIFDCDGVLVDSEPIANRVLAALLAREGLHLPEDEVMRRFVGRTKAGCIALAEEMLGRKLPASFGAAWDEALFATLRAELKPVEGIAALLAEMRLPYCVATNSSPERLHLALETTGLAPFFEGRAFSAVEVARPKPAPDLFLHAAQAMGAAPSRCVVVEDTPTGARAACAAGMAVLGFAAAPHADAAGLRKEGATLVHTVNEIAMRLRAG